MSLQDTLEKGIEHQREFVKSGCVDINGYYRHWSIAQRRVLLPLGADMEKKLVRREINLARLAQGEELL